MVMIGELCTGHRWRKTREQQPWNNTKQIFPEQKTKKSFVLRHLCPVHEVLSGIWNSLIVSGQIVNSFGQGKCTFDRQSGNFKTYSSGNHDELVENWETDQLQHDLYVNISYKFTLAWLFVSHAFTQINVNTFINDLVGTAYSTRTRLQSHSVSPACRLDREMRRRLILQETWFYSLKVFYFLLYRRRYFLFVSELI